MAENRIVKLYNLFKSGKPVTRGKVASEFGYGETSAQTLMNHFISRGIPVKVTESQGRSHLAYQCYDADAFAEMVANSGRMRKVTAKKAEKTERPLSATQAGRMKKHADRPKKAEPVSQDHLKDITLWDDEDDRPAYERTGQAPVLDKDVDLVKISEREVNDLNSMLGISVVHDDWGTGWSNDSWE